MPSLRTGAAGVLDPGTTCWRRAVTGRAALIIDIEEYFDAAVKAMRQAKHTVHLLNWAFEPDTLMHPEPGCGGPDADRIGNVLKALAEDKPELDVRVLCWKSSAPISATQRWFTLADRKTFAGSRVRFVLDGKLPRGACHHQKAIIIDDALAFCGGADFGQDRWDTTRHLDDDPRRVRTRHAHGASDKDFDSRHEVMGLVDGAAAQALGALFRERWRRATGEDLPEPPRTRPRWPAGVAVQFRDVDVGLSRTMPAWRDEPAIREVEALHLAAIAQARRCIYMENQYFTSPLIAAALARRLTESDGPEVVLVGTEHSPSYFDQATMDGTRVGFIEHLKRADKHDRFRAYSPVTTLGRIIIVHAKLTIIDDRLLRIGSANINNRSLGFDTECDLSIACVGPGQAAGRAEITRLRNHLLAHWLGCDDAIVGSAIARHGSVVAAIEGLRTAGYARLRPVLIAPLKGLKAIVARYHVGDPFAADDAWRPWRRQRLAESAARRVRAQRPERHQPSDRVRQTAS